MLNEDGRMTATLTACDKDSSAGYVDTLHFADKEDFLSQYNQYKENVPFSRWYIEVESEDTDTEKLVESWLED